MKKRTRILIYLFFSMGVFFILSSIHAFGQDSTETVTDIDDNIYHTVKIGTQTWMLEDLKVTTLNNGAPIQNIPGNEVGALSWDGDAAGAYCWYNNSIASKKTYGALYNWYVVETGVLCPQGWHVPSTEEWQILIDYLGGVKLAGGKMKEIGTSHWKTPNKGADNSSGFTALPGGGRLKVFGFGTIGETSWWWTSTKKNIFNANVIALTYKSSEAIINAREHNSGYSVRCVKD